MVKRAPASRTKPPRRPACFATDEECDLFAREWLVQRGFAVTEDANAPEVQTKALQGISGLSSSALHKRMHHPYCPPFRAWRGPTGRICSVILSQPLREWLCAPKRAGKRIVTGHRVRPLPQHQPA